MQPELVRIAWGEGRAAVEAGRWFGAARVARRRRYRRWLLGEVRRADAEVWSWCVAASAHLPCGDPAQHAALALGLALVALEPRESLHLRATWFDAGARYELRASALTTGGRRLSCDVCEVELFDHSGSPFCVFEAEVLALDDRDLFGVPSTLTLWDDFEASLHDD